MAAEFSATETYERLKAQCDAHEKIRAEVKKELWSLLKIPIAPASIITSVTGVLMHQDIIDQKLGWGVIIADALWSLYKVLGVYRRCKSKEVQQMEAIRRINDILDRATYDRLEALSVVETSGIDIHAADSLPIDQNNSTRVSA